MAISNPTQERVGYPVVDTERYGDWERLLRNGNFTAFTRSLIEWNRQMAESINLLMQAKTNNRGDMTVPSTVSVFTLEDSRIGAATIVQVVPTDAIARNASRYWQQFPNAQEGKAVLNFTADPTNDRNFLYFLVG